MSTTTPLQKAKLIELNADLSDKTDGKTTTVQFNPETLKVAFSNQIVQPSNSAGGASNSSSQASKQFVGSGTTKLALQLWFDVSGPPPKDQQTINDVRELTKEVVYFMTPKKDNTNQNQMVPPAVCFRWGSFSFKGIFDSLEESLEFFSDQGVPLRASMNISMSQQSIQDVTGPRENTSPPGAPGGSRSGVGGLGRSPLAQAPAGSSLQAMAANAGRAGDWQAIAEANGIENPRLLSPGQIINLNIRTGS